MWEPSPPPEEDWEDGVNEDGEWPMVGVVGEEIDQWGSPIYEIRWAEWKRADGSNTTWMTHVDDHPSVIKLWRQRQGKKRYHQTQASLDIRVHGGLDIHNTKTLLRSQAYEDKLEKSKKSPIPTSTLLRQRMEKLLREKEDIGNDASSTSTGPTLRHGTRQHRLHRSSSSRSKISSPSPSLSTSRSAASSGSTRGARSSRSLPRTIATASSSSRHEEEPTLASAFHFCENVDLSRLKRDKIQEKWRKAARKERAALISIVNEVDDEDVPNIDEGFTYCERKYVFGKHVQPLKDAECFVCCDCDECVVASACNCQDPSDLVDKHGNKEFAYTEEGLFAFNVTPGIDVIECNAHCLCDDSCSNRVAQKPRDVPIEVFKTENYGWGARASVDVEKGKVLGIYTGQLVRREEVEGREDGFCFDLDGNEDHNEEVPENSYSVDSLNYGNWTRYINHSCAPNTRVFQVVYDTIPEMNMPYLAFVAVEDIPARDELTVDYHPANAREIEKRKGKGKAKAPDGAIPCLCGSAQCRLWI